MDHFSVTAAHSTFEDDSPAIAVKLSCSAYELNVWLRPSEVALLARVRKTPWEEGAVRAGTSADANVFWSCDDDEVLVAVGHDDETWDFGVTISLKDFEQVLDEIQRELREPIPP